MKPTYKIASSVGAAALILAGSAIAADAITPGLGSGTNDPFGDPQGELFDQWTVTSGNIDASSCTNNFTCGAALEDDGFFTRLITNDSTGEMFFHTIVTEADANGDPGDLTVQFSDENFVSGSNSVGILDRQRIKAIELMYAQNNTIAGFRHFDNFTEIGTGWASDYLVLTQKIEDDDWSTSTVEDFQTDFIFHQKGYSTDIDKSVGMKITQYVPIARVDANNVVQAWDKQDLVLVDLRGEYAPNVGDPDVEIVDQGFNGQNQLGGGTLNWNAEERIYGLWIGQELDDVAGQQFGFVAYDIDPEVAGDRIQAFTLADTWAEPGIGIGETPGWDTSLWGTLETTGTISVLFPHPLD